MILVRAAGMTLTSAVILACAGSGATPPEQTLQRDIQLPAQGARKASLTGAAQGTFVVLAWLVAEDNAIWLRFAVSNDEGKRFGQSKRVGRADLTSVVTRPAVVVLPGSGGGKAGPRIMAAWPAARQGQWGIIQASSDDLGQSFNEVFLGVQGLPDKSALSSLTFGPSGQLHALWIAGSLLTYARTDGGAFAAPIQLDTSVSLCSVSAIAVGADSKISVIWHRSFADKVDEFAYITSQDGGQRFGKMLRVSHERWGFTKCPDAFPSLTVDATGAIRFVFRAQPPGDPPRPSFFSDRSADGRTFRPRTLLEVSGFNDPQRPQLLPDRSGGLGLVWDGIRNGRRYVMIRHSLGAPGGLGGLDADWMRPGPPIVLDQTGLGAEPVVVPVRDGVLTAWLTGRPDKLLLAGRRLGIDELCGEPSAKR